MYGGCGGGGRGGSVTAEMLTRCGIEKVRKGRVRRGRWDKEGRVRRKERQ